MPIHFDAERLEAVKDAHARWWKGELDRPLVRATILDAYAAPKAEAPVLSRISFLRLRTVATTSSSLFLSMISLNFIGPPPMILLYHTRK